MHVSSTVDEEEREEMYDCGECFSIDSAWV